MSEEGVEMPTAIDLSVLKCDECGEIVNPEIYQEYQDLKESSCGECDFGKLKPHSVKAVRRQRISEIMKVLENQPDMSYVEMWSKLKASVEKKDGDNQ